MLLYTAQQSHDIDRLAIAQGADGFALMQAAASFACECLLKMWPEAHSVAIVAGSGNNGGDGLVMAQLLKQQGLSVRVFSVDERQPTAAEALAARALLMESGIALESFSAGMSVEADVVVDAMLGVGFTGELKLRFAEAARWLNAHVAPCLAIDLPSGLYANSGAAAVDCVQAAATVSFIVPKVGHYVGLGPKKCGRLFFSDLGVSELVRAACGPGIELLNFQTLKALLPPRVFDSHKGNYGHVLLIGGDEGYGGAVILAAIAALRLGAGKVTLATKACHVEPALAAQPEIMVKAVNSASDLTPLLSEATVVVIGPGLGVAAWGEHLLAAVLASGKPCVLDADALNIIAKSMQPLLLSHCVLTPHPGEAGRLLGLTNQAIQADRLAAVQALQQKYQACVLLKGAASLVASATGLGICPYGNAYMASGGMGDVLSGIIGAFIAQGLSLSDALQLAVAVHAKAADMRLEKEGGLGLVASDLLRYAGYLMNDKI